MRLKLNERSLPRSFSKHPKAKGILVEKDLRLSQSRLRAKLLIFKSAASLHRFWSEVLGKRGHSGGLSRDTKGAVNSLFFHCEKITKRGEKYWMLADKRYFCIIGMVRGWFSAEIVTHESVHASYSYAKRVVRSPWKAQAKHFDEELIAYPAGKIAAEINDVYHRNKKLCQTSATKSPRG